MVVSGASGNVITSAVGDILGVDIKAQGLGYRKAPFVDISDSCGKGGGVRARAEIEPDGGIDPQTNQPTYKVRRVVCPHFICLFSSFFLNFLLNAF